MTADPCWHEKPAGQRYRVGPVFFFWRLVVIAGTSLRAAGRLFPLVGEWVPGGLGEPAWTTGRWWLLRLGLAGLRRPKEQAEDWIWLVDHSAQIGQEKCLVVLGVRAAELPPVGECLRHEHVQLIHLRVLNDPDKEDVERELEVASQQGGVPRAIVNDHGADIHGGVERFRQRHEQTLEIYDITHKAACLLKHRLERDERWSGFTRALGQTKVAVLQTELAYLAPPVQRWKSRYMNLEPLLNWALKTLAVVDQPPAALLAETTPERFEKKLGWLRDYREALAEWSEWQALVEAAESLVRRQGLYLGVAREMEQALAPLAQRASGQTLARELVEFVAAQAQPLRPGERLAGSTEVLESLFGKLKALEKDQAKKGFSGLVLSLGAMVWKTTTATVQAALTSCSVQAVVDWCQQNLGTTVQARRRLAYRTPP